MSSQGQTNIPTTEYSLKSISWHLKTISERLERLGNLFEKTASEICSSQKKPGTQKAPIEECPF